MFLACKFGYDKAALLLLSKGADPNKAAKDDDGDVQYVETPLYEAIQEAAESGSTEVVRVLLERGADPNKGYRRTDEDGNVYVETPLHHAAWKGSIEVVKSLLESGARQDLDTGGGERG